MTQAERCKFCSHWKREFAKDAGGKIRASYEAPCRVKRETVKAIDTCENFFRREPTVE